jgi:hypothetical protein
MDLVDIVDCAKHYLLLLTYYLLPITYYFSLHSLFLHRKRLRRML